MATEAAGFRGSRGLVEWHAVGRSSICLGIRLSVLGYELHSTVVARGEELVA